MAGTAWRTRVAGWGDLGDVQAARTHHLVRAQREVRFIHVHRLLAVFWRILGITAKAQVDLRLD